MAELHSDQDWNPRSKEVLEQPLANFDLMRESCPVAYSDYMGWSVFRHADVLSVVSNDKIFSNRVSCHRSVPNGLDEPEHTPYRRLIEPFFSDARMAEFEPVCRNICEQLALKVSGRENVNVVSEFAEDFALQVQCAFLGWPDHWREPLRQWAHENFGATLAGDRNATAEIARRFSGYIADLLDERRGPNNATVNDNTTELLNSRMGGEPMPEQDIVSILRNWTVGEVGTITASVTILLHYLAEQPALQQQLRREPELIPEAVDEILRLHGPLVTNRRRAVEDTAIGGCPISTGDRVTVNWIAANRDPQTFAQPEKFRWGRDQSHNLLYGAGVHVCPGAPLARLELRVLLETLLTKCDDFRLNPEHSPQVAHYPASGYSALWINFSRARGKAPL